MKKIGDCDFVFCGRQAIDGDTAQVGPQVAEKLGIPQITYAETVVEIEDNEIVVQRAFDLGTEIVKCTLPCLLTVVSSANQPRPASARKKIQYKMAATPLEYKNLLKQWPEFETEEALDDYLTGNDLKIPVWTADDIDAEPEKLGLGGSPTQVFKVNFVVLESTESKDISPDAEGIKAMIEDLIQEYMVG